MSGQGFVFKMFSAFGSYRSTLLSNRVAVVSYQQTAGARNKTAQEKLEAMDLPLKPKRPLTPYFSFMVDRRAELTKQNPQIKIMEVSAKCAQEWNNSEEEVKEKYKEKFKAEMNKYIEKHLQYCAQLSPEQRDLLKEAAREKTHNRKLRRLRKANKESGKPKRVRNPFSFYVKEKATNSTKGVTEIMKDLKASWDVLSNEEKQKYVDLFEDDKKRYELEINAWEQKMIKFGNDSLIRQSTLVEKKSKMPAKKTKKTPK